MASLKKNGKKFATNLIEAIEKSKQQELFKLINALGIRHVGVKTAKTLANYYKTMENLEKASFESLSVQEDIGEIIAQSIYDFFILMIHKWFVIHFCYSLNGGSSGSMTVVPPSFHSSRVAFIFTSSRP